MKPLTTIARRAKAGAENELYAARSELAAQEGLLNDDKRRATKVRA